MSGVDPDALVRGVLDGDHRALARTITAIENRTPGHRAAAAALHRHAGDARVVGVTGSPGAGKSTLVDRLTAAYREEGHRVGVIGVDPASPYSGGAVLGDRVRMRSTAGDMGVFFRSMSARGALGGLSPATADAIAAYDAFGMDRIVVETVGAGQNEVEIVRTADTVVVLLQPGSGDDVQMLKAGILEIGDVFVVNKADLPGADRTVRDLREMLTRRSRGRAGSGRIGDDAGDAGGDRAGREDPSGLDGEVDGDGWEPPIVETVSTAGRGIDELLEVLDRHAIHLRETGALGERRRARYRAQLRGLLRSDLGDLLESELCGTERFEELVEAIHSRESDPYTIAEELLEPIERCVREQGADGSDRDADDDRSGDD